jgi:hypothetical protein
MEITGIQQVAPIISRVYLPLHHKYIKNAEKFDTGRQDYPAEHSLALLSFTLQVFLSNEETPIHSFSNSFGHCLSRIIPLFCHSGR